MTPGCRRRPYTDNIFCHIFWSKRCSVKSVPSPLSKVFKLQIDQRDNEILYR
ncbi:hypothetical protein OROHE_011019 [Orobanche hederae]